MIVKTPNRLEATFITEPPIGAVSAVVTSSRMEAVENALSKAQADRPRPEAG